MAETKIALYGSTKLSEENISFVSRLCNAFLSDPHVILINGGIYDPDKKVTSVDLATYKSTLAFVNKSGQKLENRLQTWLPQEKREGIDRKPWGKTKYLHGSPRSRRFKLVRGVDAIVTIGGEGKTATVLELAMALKRTVLPIGFTGTNSLDFWESDRAFFEKSIDLGRSLSRRLDDPPKTENELEELARDIAKAVLKKAGRRCLVLMDFTDKEHKKFYKEVVVPAIKKSGFSVHKLDEHESAGDILELFLKRLTDCHAIIIDLTGFNINVVYELGRIHEKGVLPPLILIREKAGVELPFYISKNLVHIVGKKRKLAGKRIVQHLTDERSKILRQIC